ncbi:MAG TPA: transglycosylase SLT domain-containing protein [Ktedonosporobacter sp.]|nr:transglycosylase SLT domain-containing protein [Ktedonosporobacter sp.]
MNILAGKMDLRKIGTVVAAGLILLLILLGQQVVAGGGGASLCTQGTGAWSVVQRALDIVKHLSGPNINQYDATNQALTTYWQSHKVNFNNVQPVDFITAAYGLAGHPLPDITGNPVDYWAHYNNNQHPGWTTIPAGTGPPMPGDLVVMSGGNQGSGYIAVVAAVHRLVNGVNGDLILAQASLPGNITTPNVTAPEISTNGLTLLNIPLLPNNAIASANNTYGNYTVLGFIRNPSLATQFNTANASLRLQTINQGDPNQYNQTYPALTWADATCGPTSLAMILNAYTGRTYKVSDILPIGIQVGLENPPTTLGVANVNKFAAVAAHFGFQTQMGGLTLDQAIASANTGNPVMANFPPGNPGRYGKFGHFVVLVSGDSQYVRIANPDGGHFEIMTRATFTSWMVNSPFISFKPQTGQVTTDAGMCSSPGGLSTAAIPANVLAQMPNSPYVQMAWNTASKYGFNPTYFLNQIKLESNFNATARSGTRVGIAGLDVSMARQVGLTVNNPNSADPTIDERLDPAKALDAAARLVTDLYRKYLGVKPSTAADQAMASMEALAAYNCGDTCLTNTIKQAQAAHGSTVDPKAWWHFWGLYLPGPTRTYIVTILNIDPNLTTLDPYVLTPS